MLRRRHSALLFAICLCFAVGAGVVPNALAKGHGHNQAEVWKRQVEDLEQQWRTAILTVDIPLMDKLLSEDYVGISMAGEISTKTMSLDRLRTSDLSMKKLDLSDVKVKLLGRVAIVTSLADVEGTVDGTPVQGRFRYTRVYQRLSTGAWKITNFEATRLRPKPEDDHSQASQTAHQD